MDRFIVTANIWGCLFLRVLFLIREQQATQSFRVPYVETTSFWSTVGLDGRGRGATANPERSLAHVPGGANLAYVGFSRLKWKPDSQNGLLGSVLFRNPEPRPKQPPKLGQNQTRQAKIRAFLTQLEVLPSHPQNAGATFPLRPCACCGGRSGPNTPARCWWRAKAERSTPT